MRSLKLDPDTYEDLRRVLMLAEIAITLAQKIDRDNWREQIRLAMPDEFAVAEATVDDYLRSLEKTTDRLV